MSELIAEENRDGLNFCLVRHEEGTSWYAVEVFEAETEDQIAEFIGREERGEFVESFDHSPDGIAAKIFFETDVLEEPVQEVLAEWRARENADAPMFIVMSDNIQVTAYRGENPYELWLDSTESEFSGRGVKVVKTKEEAMRLAKMEVSFHVSPGYPKGKCGLGTVSRVHQCREIRGGDEVNWRDGEFPVYVGTKLYAVSVDCDPVYPEPTWEFLPSLRKRQFTTDFYALWRDLLPFPTDEADDPNNPRFGKPWEETPNEEVTDVRTYFDRIRPRLHEYAEAVAGRATFGEE